MTDNLEDREYTAEELLQKVEDGEIKYSEGFKKLQEQEENHTSTDDQVYEDRNLAVLAYLKSQKQLAESHPNVMAEVGYRDAPNFGDEWVYIWIDRPEGQQSWCVHRKLVENLDWLEKKEIEYDGHDREEKNQRMKDYIGLE